MRKHLHWDSKYTININTEMNYWPRKSPTFRNCISLSSICWNACAHQRRTAKPCTTRAGSLAITTHRYLDTHRAARVVGSASGPWARLGSSLHNGKNTTRFHARPALSSGIMLCIESDGRRRSQFLADYLVDDGAEPIPVTGPSNLAENAFKLPDGKTARNCMGPAI
jgi:hypothetical protein